MHSSNGVMLSAEYFQMTPQATTTSDDLLFSRLLIIPQMTNYLLMKLDVHPKMVRGKPIKTVGPVSNRWENNRIESICLYW